MRTKRSNEDRAKVTAERLNMILDEVFHGDKHLLAFMMDTTPISLNNWLSGKNAVSSNKAFLLGQVVPKYNYLYIAGYTDDNEPHDTEYWETLNPYSEGDLYRKEILIRRHLIGTRDKLWQYRQQLNRRAE